MNFFRANTFHLDLWFVIDSMITWMQWKSHNLKYPILFSIGKRLSFQCIQMRISNQHIPRMTLCLWSESWMLMFDLDFSQRFVMNWHLSAFSHYVTTFSHLVLWIKRLLLQLNSTTFYYVDNEHVSTLNIWLQMFRKHHLKSTQTYSRLIENKKHSVLSFSYEM